MPGKRDAAYYRKRLKKEFPKEYADLLAGRITSVRKAAQVAGLIHLPTRLDALKRDWKKATPAQKQDFALWLKANRLKAVPARVIADSAGKLSPPAVAFLKDWTKKNRLKPGHIMEQMGFKVYDPTLSYAIFSGGKLRLEAIHALEKWMPANGF